MLTVLGRKLDWSVIMARVFAIAGLFVPTGVAFGYIPQRWIAPVAVISLAVVAVLKPVQNSAGIVRPADTQGGNTNG